MTRLDPSELSGVPSRQTTRALSKDALALHAAFLAAQEEGASTTLHSVRRRVRFDHARAYFAMVELMNAGALDEVRR